MGRPSKYNAKLAERLCGELANGKSLIRICRQGWAPSKTTVLRWLDKHAQFRVRYALARELQADHYAAEIIDLADRSRKGVRIEVGKDGTKTITADMVERSRLQVDARKWYAGKLAPKKYGDKVQQEHTGPDGAPLQVTVEFVSPNARCDDSGN